MSRSAALVRWLRHPLSPKALARSRGARLPRAFWGWDEIVEMSADGYWPYTPNTTLLYGLSEALDMILAHGLPAIFARHRRWSEAAVRPGACRRSAPTRRCTRRSSPV